MTPPRMSTSGGRTRVAHREYLGDVVGSVGFAIAKTVPINPGLSASFPWLSNIARQYESYYVRSMTFEYETQESTATAGTVMLAVDYDAADPAPTSKMQLLSYKGAVRTPGWAPMKFHCTMPEMVVHGAGKYVRYVTLAPGLDIKMYDVGNLYLATQGFAGPTVAGELYVSYVIDFMTPQLEAPITFSNASAKIVGDVVNVVSIFGDVNTVTGALPVSARGSTLTFPERGSYLVALRLGGTYFTAINPVLLGTATVKSLGGDVAIRTSEGNTSALFYFQVQVTEPGMTVIVDATQTATTVTSSLTRVALYSYAL